ncbi:hypothetical protein FUA23_16725 [Neolewinella aurantiaca]|uniref:Uncharacterized protein n=1 Tax=Neolewinella aurantiaca TaxID=2602767 RepID=A0A5C7FR52_9BACT|nr:hypothetical protein [Neolewinella aurantiaca]TXF87902.1 hypothetical protein FUA23_16725 [Neolewinella aurantiaca]
MFNLKSIIALFVFMLSSVSLLAGTSAATIVNDSLPAGADQAKLEQIEKMLTHSPHYKNRNAAGRVEVLRRNAPAATASKQETLTGPAYKNRKRTPVAADTTAAPTYIRRKLISPHYKNRSAKSRRSL